MKHSCREKICHSITHKSTARQFFMPSAYVSVGKCDCEWSPLHNGCLWIVGSILSRIKRSSEEFFNNERRMIFRKLSFFSHKFEN